MARTEKQKMLQKQKVTIANDLLAYLKEEGIEKGKNNAIPLKFIEERNIELYTGWQSWAMLYKAGRLIAIKYPGYQGWEVADYTPIETNENGDPILPEAADIYNLVDSLINSLLMFRNGKAVAPAVLQEERIRQIVREEIEKLKKERHDARIAFGKYLLAHLETLAD
ncbi:MAG: hypothetical protein PHU23_03220 [Dehalococcoidales bacterium]|nr:hypothetical protein [Dehalococcoidales bacterium]